MAAPSATARGTPSGIPLRSGHSTKITFASQPTISFWEKTVTPSGYDNGDPIDTKTMHDVRYRGKAPRPLIESTDISISVAYDPNVLNAIKSLIGVEDTITETFPDGSSKAEFGFLKSFTPQENSEENQPMADVTIVITNRDPHASWAEAGPVITNVPGT